MIALDDFIPKFPSSDAPRFYGAAFEENLPEASKQRVRGSSPALGDLVTILSSIWSVWGQSLPPFLAPMILLTIFPLVFRGNQPIRARAVSRLFRGGRRA